MGKAASENEYLPEYFVTPGEVLEDKTRLQGRPPFSG